VATQYTNKLTYLRTY